MTVSTEVDAAKVGEAVHRKKPCRCNTLLAELK
jgi:hypothetical protein